MGCGSEHITVEPDVSQPNDSLDNIFQRASGLTGAEPSSRVVELQTKLIENFKQICKKLGSEPTETDKKLLSQVLVTMESNPQLCRVLTDVVVNDIYPSDSATTPASAVHLNIQVESQNVLFGTAKTFQDVRATSIIFVNQGFNYDYVQLIGALVAQCRPRVVIMQQCAINLDRIGVIVDNLQRAPFLGDIVYMDLSSNPLTDDGCIAVIKLFQRQESVRYLLLRQTQARNGSLRQLCDQMDGMLLQEVDFSDNPGVSRESYQQVLDMIQQAHTITSFRLENCGLNSQQLINIRHFTTRNRVCQQCLDGLVSDAIGRVLNLSPARADDAERLPATELKKNDILSKLSGAPFPPLLVDELAEKLTMQCQNKRVHYSYDIASAETMGRRQEMEDVQVVISDFHTYRLRRCGIARESTSRESLVCLFDGHGGRDVSEGAAEILPGVLADQLNSIMRATGFVSLLQIPDAAWEPVMTSLFLTVDAHLQERRAQAGSTAAVLLLVDNLVVQANCGDSRAVLTRDHSVARAAGLNPAAYPVRRERAGEQVVDGAPDVLTHYVNTQPSRQMNLACRCYNQLNASADSNQLVVRLSHDHKPSNDEEQRRIEQDGGYVQNRRLLGIISVSRSFGDFNFKPAMSVVPYVSTYWLQNKDIYIILACDGVWDVLQDIDAAMITLGCQNPQSASIKIRDEAYKCESGDNISVICCKINRGKWK